MAYITAENLQLGYDSTPVASPLSFSVNKGDYLCIIGENGSGKSTLVKTILKLIKPLSGTLETGDGLMPNEIGYLPQQNAIQKDFPASVFEIVLSGTLPKCGFRPFYGKAEKQLALDCIEKMGITNLKDTCYRNLSGGQQQRVLLARALCATSKIILLDEPVTGLDPKATNELYRLIKTLNTEGITVIMISHDITGALPYASHVLCIQQGKSYFCTSAEYAHIHKEMFSK